ncbi:hypothetical protein Tco_0158083 [Tanacetum coccineum]
MILSSLTGSSFRERGDDGSSFNNFSSRRRSPSRSKSSSSIPVRIFIKKDKIEAKTDKTRHEIGKSMEKSERPKLKGDPEHPDWIQLRRIDLTAHKVDWRPRYRSRVEIRGLRSCGFSLNNGTCMNCTYGDGKPVTCCECESPLNGGFCLICASRAGNSSACDPNLNSYNDSPNFSDYTPQPQYQTYYCELCENNAHYCYNCPPQSPFVYNQDPCFNQNFDNNFPQTSPSLPQQYLCCENCGGPLESFQCQSMNKNFYNSNSSGFDQLQPPQYPVIHNPPQETSVEILQAKEDLMKSIQTFLKKFNQDIQELLHKLLKDVQIISEELSEFINCPSWNRPTFYDDDDEEYTIQFREYLENLSKAITHDLPTEEPEYSLSMGDKHLGTIPETESNEVIKSSVENLVPIPSESEVTSDNESECDVPVNDESSPIFMTFSNPLFDSNDDFTFSDEESLSDEDVPMENFKIYSNHLFDNEEIISTKIDPHYFNVESNVIESLLNRDTWIDSSPKFDYLLKEFSGELAHINPISPRIEEADFDLEEEICLVKNLSYDNSSPRPPEELNAEIVDTILEFLSPSPIPVEDTDSLMEEIDLFLASDKLMPPSIKNDDYDSEGDIHFLEELLSNDSPPLPKNESSNLDYFNDPSSPRPPLEPLDVEICIDFDPDTDLDFTPYHDSLRSRNKIFNPGIFLEVQSERLLSRDGFSISFIRDPLYLVFDTLLLFSFKNEDKVFKPGILSYLLVRIFIKKDKIEAKTDKTEHEIGKSIDKSERPKPKA